MDINTMKHAAKKAARAGGTSYQAELNRIAAAQGYTHWGAILEAQPRSSLHYRWNPSDEQNARDLQDARQDHVNIVYVADKAFDAVAHVAGMARTLDILPPPSTPRMPRLIEAPSEVVLLDGAVTREWRGLRRVSRQNIGTLPSGAVVIAERLEPDDVLAASKPNVILIGATTLDDIRTWPQAYRNRLMGLVIPEQSVQQIGKLYAREDHSLIYDTLAVKHVLPITGDGDVGRTTITRSQSSS